MKTLTQITPQLGFGYLLDFGFSTLIDRRVESNGQVVTDIGQALALGGITDGVTNLELNAAYATIANQGTYIKPKLYTKIVDHDGNVLIDNSVPETRQVLKPTTAWLLTDAMVSVVSGGGTGASVNFGNMAIAGKTGTTSDYKDVWFSGYTPYYTCTTWTGYDNNVNLKTSAEKALSKTLWKAVMSKIHENLPNKGFPRVGGITEAQVCALSGKLPVAGLCDNHIITEKFAEGTVPTEYCDVHYYGSVCAYTGLKATEVCPFAVNSPGERIPERLTDEAINSAMGANPSTLEDGTQTTQMQQEEQLCPHNQAFMADPNASIIIEQQRAYMFQLQQQQQQAMQ